MTQAQNSLIGKIQLAGERKRIGKCSSLLFRRIQGKTNPEQGPAEYSDRTHRHD